MATRDQIVSASAHGHQVPPDSATVAASPIRRTDGTMTRTIAHLENANSQSREEATYPFSTAA
jgi:hypothetical protein